LSVTGTTIRPKVRIQPIESLHHQNQGELMPFIDRTDTFSWIIVPIIHQFRRKSYTREEFQPVLNQNQNRRLEKFRTENLHSLQYGQLWIVPCFNGISRSKSYHIREALVTVVHAFVTSRIDYCNSLLYGIFDYNINRLQRIQNSAARIVTNTRKHDHITPILQKLHWLLVRQRIYFKILLITGVH